MKIIALGTGSAFTMQGRQTNYIIQHNGKNLLVDCGSDIRWSLQEHGFKYTDIDAVYVSHCHQDHIGGLEFLGYTRYFTREYQIQSKAANPLPLPKLFCKREMILPLWEKSLSGGMSCIDGIDRNIDTYFDVQPVDDKFYWEGIQFVLVQSEHISGKYTKMDSFGLIFTSQPHGPSTTDTRESIYISTDTRFVLSWAFETDVIIHDCETMYNSGVHAHYDQLKTLPDDIKAKITLIHYQDNVLENWDEWEAKAKADGFKGFAKPGVIYESAQSIIEDLSSKGKKIFNSIKENMSWFRDNILEKMNENASAVEKELGDHIKKATEMSNSIEQELVKEAKDVVVEMEKIISENKLAEDILQRLKATEAKKAVSMYRETINAASELLKNSETVKEAHSIYMSGKKMLQDRIQSMKVDKE
jgi:ribonuclease BN (tRNA processing enzyme)